MNALLFLSFLFSLPSSAQTCSTEKGVNLTDPGKSFSSIYPRDQGTLGTCFSYSACDLLRSHIGATAPFNPSEAAINSDEDLYGGDPGGVLKSLIDRGWACTHSGSFQNLFPSETRNILVDLEAISMDMPVFYTYDPIKNQARQDRIAKKAAEFYKNPKGCQLENECTRVTDKIEDLQKSISKLENKKENLRDELNTLDWGWVNYISGSRDNSEIYKDIKEVKKSIQEKEKTLETLEKKNENLQKLMDGKNNLDAYDEDTAAQIVYYWGKKTYARMVEAFKNYGVKNQDIPTFSQYVTERVQRDPVMEWAYAGRMYGYKLVKKMVANSCQPPNRQSISKNIVVKNEPVKDWSSGVNQVKKLLEMKKPQGAVISMHSNYIRKGTWESSVSSDLHAMVVVGCRTVNGQLQFLLHNSWGQGCQSYASQFQCVSGRIWVPAGTALSASTNLHWLENR